MKQSSILLVLCILFCSSYSFSQITDGHIQTKSGEGIENIILFSKNSQVQAITDMDGYFVIDKFDLDSIMVFVSFQSKIMDSFLLKANHHFDIQIENSLLLGTVDIYGFRSGSKLENLPQKVESLNSLELQKAACCDLAGCFGTQSTVQSATTNIITNSKELRMLGLSGVYTQLLLDGIPTMIGYNYTYGLNNVSGALIDKIFVSKGAASILQGFEGMVGQINVIPKNYATAPTHWYFNGYANNFGESQVNIVHNDKYKNFTFTNAVHLIFPSKIQDANSDGFRDNPQRRYINFYQQTSFGNPSHKYQGMYTARFLSNKLINGQVDYKSGDNPVDQGIFGVKIKFIQPELSVKQSYQLTENSQLFSNLHYSYHDQNSFFGAKNLDAVQKYFYGTLESHHTFSEKIKLNSGFTYRDINVAERFFTRDTNINKATIFHIPGVFGEISGTLNKQVQYILGSRIDLVKGQTNWVNRGLLRWLINDYHQVRIWAGQGYRVPIPMADHSYILANSKDLYINDNLAIEKSINIGFNYAIKWYANNYSHTLSTDLDYAKISSPIIPVYENFGKVIVNNLTTPSYAKTFQIDYAFTGHKNFDTKIGIVFQSNKNEHFSDGRIPFFPLTRINFSSSLYTKNRKWQLDNQFKFIGGNVLPPISTQGDNTSFHVDPVSDYLLWDATITYRMKLLEFYIGCENITGFKQANMLVNPKNPFSNTFDSAYLWGPTFGQEIFVGFRLSINPIKR